MTARDLATVLPATLVGGWACLLLIVDLFIPRGRKGWTAFLAAVGLVIALVSLLSGGSRGLGFGGMIVADGFSAFLGAVFLISGLIVLPLTVDYLRRMDIERGEYYALLLFSLAGMMLMAQAGDLAVVFLALELLSLPLYVLAGFARPRVESEESAMKYFLLGAFASALVAIPSLRVAGDYYVVASFGLQVHRLDEKQCVFQWKGEKIAAQDCRSLLIPQRQLGRQLRILIDPGLASNDQRAAFAHSVDLVLHPNDLPHFEEALKHSRAETEIRYRLLKESLQAMGKA